MNIVWLNGVLSDAAESRIDPADRGFTLGDGVFETLLASNGKPLHLGRHLARLRQGAAVLGLMVPVSDETLAGAMETVLRENRLLDAAMRLTLTRGPAPRGVLPVAVTRPTVLITAGPLPAALPPAHVIIAQRTRRNASSPLARIKSLNYLDSILARMEAAEQGADDALLLDTDGNLAEATAANVFLFMGGRFVTPRLADGALPGIARARLLEAALVTEARIPLQHLPQAEAGFLANSLGWRTLSSVGAHALDSGHPALGAIRRHQG